MPKCGSGFVYCICIYSSKHLRHVDAWTPFQCRPCEAYVPKEHRQFLDRLRNAPQSSGLT